MRSVFTRYYDDDDLHDPVCCVHESPTCELQGRDHGTEAAGGCQMEPIDSRGKISFVQHQRKCCSQAKATPTPYLFIPINPSCLVASDAEQVIEVLLIDEVFFGLICWSLTSEDAFSISELIILTAVIVDSLDR